MNIVEKARVKLVLNDPFLGSIILGMPVVEDRTIWMAATDGTSLFINSENFSKLPLEEAVGVYKHEAMHVALLHPFRGHGYEPKRYNTAADLVINPIILAEGGKLPHGVLDGSKYPNMTTEQVYALLPPEPEDKDGNGGSGGKGNGPMDDDIRPAPDKSAAAEANVMARVAQAAAIAKAMGKMGGAMRDAVDAAMTPSVDWTVVLREFLTETNVSDYSFARPNRRFVSRKIYLPSRHSQDAMGKLGVVVDTSGSMGAAQLRYAFGEIVGAVEGVSPSSLVVVYCDADVNHVDRFDRAEPDDVRDSAKRVGGGGTDMTVALDWFEEHEPDVKAIIVLTDGYTPFGEERSVPVLWAIDNDHVVSPVGRTVRVGKPK